MSTARRTLLAWSAAALLVSAGAAVATRTIAHTASGVTIGGTTPPFVEFVAGANSGASDHVANFALGANRTTFSVRVMGYGGSTTVVTDLVAFRNVHGSPHGVTLRANQETNVKVTNLSLQIFQGATSLGYLDLKTPTPTRSLGSMPASANYSMRLVYGLSPGAGANDISSMTIFLQVTP